MRIFRFHPTLANSESVGWWGIDAANSRRVRDTTIRSSNVDRLELAWAFGLPQTGDARSQMVATRHSVFVASSGGYVFALLYNGVLAVTSRGGSNAAQN